MGDTTASIFVSINAVCSGIRYSTLDEMLDVAELVAEAHYLINQ